MVFGKVVVEKPSGDRMGREEEEGTPSWHHAQAMIGGGGLSSLLSWLKHCRGRYHYCRRDDPRHCLCIATAPVPTVLAHGSHTPGPCCGKKDGGRMAIH